MPRRLPLVDVMVSVHGIGPIFADTVLSVLNQRAETFRLRCLVVVDGCPFVDDVAPVLADLTASGLHDLSVIYQRNAGVTAARNRAIAHFLAQGERADYAFFMDGDDLAPPNFIAAGLAALQRAEADPRPGLRPGWAFADQFHFGDQAHWVQYPRELWGARFALNNLSQPSSLISMAMLEAGVAFDGSFVHGIEDWDFWCSAVAAGFYGVHVSDSAMRYRRLLGSRSSQNRANDPLTKFRLSKKHGLDRYETLVPGRAPYPRRGLLLKTRAAAETAAGTTGLPCLSLERREVERLWSRVAMLGGVERGIVFDAPHVPDLLEVHPGAAPATPLPSDLVFALEHVCEAHPDLVFVQVAQAGRAPVLLLSPRRFYASERPASGTCATVTTGAGGAGFEFVPSRRPPPALTAENRMVLAHLRAALPPGGGPARRGFERRRVGDRTANAAAFYGAALGFLPYLPTLERREGRTEMALVVDHAALAAPETAGRIAGLLATRGGGDRRRHLVLVHGEEDGDAGMAAERLGALDVACIHHLHAIRPIEKPAPGPRYNGASFDAVDPHWLAYAAGLLSWFDEIVNLDSTPISFAIPALRARKSVATAFAPLGPASPTDTFIRLAMLVGAYDEILPPTPRWRDTAIGLGAPASAVARTAPESPEGTPR